MDVRWPRPKQNFQWKQLEFDMSKSLKKNSVARIRFDQFHQYFLTSVGCADFLFSTTCFPYISVVVWFVDLQLLGENLQVKITIMR